MGCKQQCSPCPGCKLLCNPADPILWSCRTTLIAALDVSNLTCFAVVAAPTYLPSLTELVMDSHYFGYQASGPGYLAGHALPEHGQTVHASSQRSQPGCACSVALMPTTPGRSSPLPPTQGSGRTGIMQGCTCVGMLVLKVRSDGSATCVPQGRPLQAPVPLSVILASILSGVLALVVLGLLIFVWFRVRRERSIKAAGPPGNPRSLQQCLAVQMSLKGCLRWACCCSRLLACRCCLRQMLPAAVRDVLGCAATKGQPLVMVCTDVESSTELWEWNNAIMMESLAIHDRLIRADLSRHAQTADSPA